MAEIVFSVTQINEYINKKLYNDPLMSTVSVVGEVTNYSMSSIGTCFLFVKRRREHAQLHRLRFS